MKSKASKNSAKRLPAAKKKSAAKKKPAQKSVKSSKPVGGKKSSGSKFDYDRKPIESWAADIAEKAYDDARALMQKGADPTKIQVYVFDRSVDDAMKERIVKWDPSLTDYQIVPGANVHISAATEE